MARRAARLTPPSSRRRLTPAAKWLPKCRFLDDARSVHTYMHMHMNMQQQGSLVAPSHKSNERAHAREV